MIMNPVWIILPFIPTQLQNKIFNSFAWKKGSMKATKPKVHEHQNRVLPAQWQLPQNRLAPSPVVPRPFHLMSWSHTPRFFNGSYKGKENNILALRELTPRDEKELQTAGRCIRKDQTPPALAVSSRRAGPSLCTSLAPQLLDQPFSTQINVCQMSVC